MNKLYVLESHGSIGIRVNVDMLILHEKRIVAISLYDAPALVDKITADLRAGAETYLTLHERDINNKKERPLSSFSSNRRFSNSMNIRFETKYSINVFSEDTKRKHAFITIDNNNYAFNFNNEDKVSFFKKFVALKHKTPCNEKNISSHISCFEKLDILGHNEELKKKFENSYYVNIQEFRKKIIKDNHDFLPNIETVNDFIRTFAKDVHGAIRKTVVPLYSKENKYPFEDFFLKPKPGQEKLWGSGYEVLKKSNFVFLAAEMGSGKTLSSLAINRAVTEFHRGKKAYTTFIIAPATTLKTKTGGWFNEINLTMKNSDGTDKDFDLHILKDTDIARDFMNDLSTGKINLKNPEKPVYVICSKEVLKLSSPRYPSYNIRHLKTIYKEDELPEKKNGRVYPGKFLACPKCGEPLQYELKGNLINFTESDFIAENGNPKPITIAKKRCLVCKEPIHSYFKFTKNLTTDTEMQREMKAKAKKPKVSLIDFFLKTKVKFDTVIIDEVHEGNEHSSIIGRAQALAFSLGKKRIALSGTVNNGYSSSFFNLLRAVMPNKMQKYDVMDISKFTNQFGIMKKVYKYKDEEEKKSGRSEKVLVNIVEEEGISPQLFTDFLSENYVFFQLKEMEAALPAYNEFFIPVKKESCYHIIEDFYKDISATNCVQAQMYKNSIFKHIINNPSNWDGTLVVQVPFSNAFKEFEIPNIHHEGYLNKDYEVLKTALDAKKRGRKFCICNYFNEGGKYMKSLTVTERLIKLFEENGLKLLWLKSDKYIFDGKSKRVKNVERESILFDLKEEFDGFICEPKLINVGINLPWCPTYINFMPSYEVNVVSQANRRGLRLTSILDNEVYHFYYEDTLEEDIMDRYQKKQAEARAIEANFDVAQEEHKSIRTYSKGVKDILETIDVQEIDPKTIVTEPKKSKTEMLKLF